MFSPYVSRVRRAQRSALWRNRDFLHLWSAETISQFGSQITLVTIPLIAALTLDASALQMGILAAAGGMPRLLLGFIAGTWVDRLPRRPILIWTDIGRAATFAIVPIRCFSASPSSAAASRSSSTPRGRRRSRAWSIARI
jgi:MFS family permease